MSSAARRLSRKGVRVVLPAMVTEACDRPLADGHGRVELLLQAVLDRFALQRSGFRSRTSPGSCATTGCVSRDTSCGSVAGTFTNSPGEPATGPCPLRALLERLLFQLRDEREGPWRVGSGPRPSPSGRRPRSTGAVHRYHGSEAASVISDADYPVIRPTRFVAITPTDPRFFGDGMPLIAIASVRSSSPVVRRVGSSPELRARGTRRVSHGAIRVRRVTHRCSPSKRSSTSPIFTRRAALVPSVRCAPSTECSLAVSL